VFGPPQKPWMRTEQKRGSSTSAIFGIGTATKCRSDNKVEVLEGKFRDLNFLPSSKKTPEYSFRTFLSVFRYLIFFQVLNFTSVEMNRFVKQTKLLKILFFKSKDGHAIFRQEKRRLPKSTAHSTLPRRVVLGLLSPSPRVCTGGRY